MTRAYDDIEAVTRLLEEKEKDLELTVQIGKELLTQNTRLENRVAELESDVKTANENLAQLSYDLHTKSSLLAALTNDDDVSSEASECAFMWFGLRCGVRVCCVIGRTQCDRSVCVTRRSV